jgi:hypothetical protein
MTASTDYIDLKKAIAELERSGTPESPAELSRRLDALVEAIEILARDRYEFPGLPDSNLRNALMRARRH